MIRGFAPTTRAVKSLSEAGIPAATVASLLESRSAHASEREIWIVDESSLLPTRQVNRLLHKANDEGVVRVVFVGGQRQHHAIEAGRPIYQMQQDGMPVARLDTIRRQLVPQLREAVSHAAKGEIAESLAILERRRDIREIADIEQRRKQIAREYVAAHQSGQRVLVVGPANLSAALDRFRHIDHGYASTSHSAQGATVDRVIVDIDTRLSPELVNRKQFYVSISRARDSLAIYTDDRNRFGFVINRNREKSMALERSAAAAHRGFSILPEHHRSISRGQGFRR